MKPIAFRLLAISSAALLLISAAFARTRPRYGDPLRVQFREVVPEYEGAPDLLVGPVFETLVTIHDNGRLQPGLALRWTTPDNGSRWDFTLRTGVQFHDGTPLSAAKLSQVPVPGCKLLLSSIAMMYQCDSPRPNLPSILSQPEYAVILTSGNDVFGTGPFRIETRTPGTISLKAFDNYWGGRPYLDTLEIKTGRNSRDQLNDFSFDHVDVVELAADMLRRLQQERMRVELSRPSVTLLLVFNSKKTELGDLRIRQAISLAIDRGSIHSVIFQRQGEVAGSLLPNWLTGYAFLFPTAPDQAKARDLLKQAGRPPAITIGYDPTESVQRLIAERVALNLRDVGIAGSAVASNSADLRIETVSVSSLNPAVALNALVEKLSIMQPFTSDNIESLYSNERTALQTYSAIPLVHIPKVTALKERVRNFDPSPAGQWRFADVWLAPRTTGGKP
ncbi:MAG TPA: ABC transporter substrate-binding protein [Terriglobales bacterium]|nr:ABC transporter substrate-binding protein [Terriglobales bacterium]